MKMKQIFFDFIHFVLYSVYVLHIALYTLIPTGKKVLTQNFSHFIFNLFVFYSKSFLNILLHFYLIFSHYTDIQPDMICRI